MYMCTGEGNGNPLQYSCLEDPMDGGAWWATVHGVSKSRTRFSMCMQGFLGGALVKNLLPMQETQEGSIPELGRFPWSRKWQPTPVFMPGKSQRSLVGYSLWGCKESDTTKHAYTHLLILRDLSTE